MAILPPPPVRSAVEHENRISINLNRSGTQQQNPIVGTNRSGDLTKGLPLKLTFPLADTGETVSQSFAQAVDSDGNIASSTSITSLWAESVPNLNASATIDAGGELVSSAAGQRNIVTVKTSRGRVIRQQVWVKDSPNDIVLFNGQNTDRILQTQQPLVIYVDDVSVQYTVQWSVSFFPTWNDEVGRQHGANTTAISSNILKPYGGAVTVNALRLPSTTVYSEAVVEGLTTLSYTGTGETTLDYQFKFRSKSGSSTSVLGYGSVQIVECGIGGAGDPGSVPATGWVPPVVGHDPPPPDPPPVLDDGGTPGRQISVNVLGLGPDGFATVNLTGYKAGVDDHSGTPTAFGSLAAGSQESAEYNSTGLKTITLDASLLDASLIVAEVVDGTSEEYIGNSIVFKTSETDLGMPSAPTMSSVSYDFALNRASFTIDNLGFTGELVTAHIKRIDGAILSGGAAAQDAADIFADAAIGQLDSGTYATTGAKTWDPAWTGGTPNSVTIWFTNTVGASTTLTFVNEGKSDYGSVKLAPVISAPGYVASSTINFTLDSDGFNVGNMDAEYWIIDYELGTIGTKVTKSGVVTTAEGEQTFELEAGDVNPDGLLFCVVGEQGRSNVLSLDNT